MADDDATDDGTLIDLKGLLFGSGDDEDTAAESDGGETAIEGLRAEWRPSGGEESTTDGTAEASYGAGAIEPGEGYRAEWRPSGGDDLGAVSSVDDGTEDRFHVADAAPERWLTEQGYGNVNAGAVSSVDDGTGEPRFPIADDVKHADNADPSGWGPHDVDINDTTPHNEPTEYFLDPAEPEATIDDAVVTVMPSDEPTFDDAVVTIVPSDTDLGAVTEVSDGTDGTDLLAATDSSRFEDVD